jgi:MFS family permease
MFRSKKLIPESYSNVNYLSYTLIYLVYSSVFVFLNNYFPILFYDVLDINRIILAVMQFLAYSVLLFRPVFASITDKYKINGYQRKYYIIFSGYSLVFIYILMGFWFTNVYVFGLFLFLVYISSTMLDVSTKSLIIDNSPTNEIKRKNFFFIFVGQALGGFFPFFLYFLLIKDIHSIRSWETLIICSCLFFIPLLGSLPFISERNQSKPQDVRNLEKFYHKDSKSPPNSKITLILLCIFVFLAFSDVIFVYSFFPFLLNKFGLSNFNLFNFILIFCFLISITSSSIGSFIVKKTDPKTIIIILIPVIGIIYILYIIVPFTFFIILYFVAWFLGTITNLNITVYIMKFKKGNTTTYFHLISSFKHLSTFIFLPLGTLLSSFIATEYLIITGVFLLNFSLFPLIFIKL